MKIRETDIEENKEEEEEEEKEDEIKMRKSLNE